MKNSSESSILLLTAMGIVKLENNQMDEVKVCTLNPWGRNKIVLNYIFFKIKKVENSFLPGE